MSRDFKACLDKKKLYRSDAAKALAGKEFKSATDDLADAEMSLSQKRCKWATIQAYYAMFHAARALLYSRGYRERSHFCVVAGIEHLFGETKLIELTWVRALKNAMSLREDAVYVLHSFQKKSRKTSQHDIEIACKRYKQIGG